MDTKVILITGASSGIGLATAERLVKDGHTVYGTARKPEGAEKINAVGATALIAEMTEHDTLEKAVERVIEKEGHIDVLYNNAGFGVYGAVEDVTIEDAREQFEVNMFGLARITQLVLPHMRKRGKGTIINTSSMGGKIYTPLGAWYHATKHALEGWSDCLRLEVEQFGINVVIIEPGAIGTNFGEALIRPLAIRAEGSVYELFAHQIIKATEDMYGKPNATSPASVIAHVVSKAVAAKRPKTRYSAGRYAKLMMFIRKYAGDRIFDRVIMSMVK